MAFPVSPTHGQQYTNTLGTTWEYDSPTGSWRIVFETIDGDHNVDGGWANATYLPTQVIDGGSA
jgi:hypothetical protein